MSPAPAPLVGIVGQGQKLDPSMNLHADKRQSVLVRTSVLEWLTSAQANGVSRRMIERRGGEVARATTIVRFDPNKEFPRHAHSGGEEFLVLAGTWRDDYGDFPKYTYIRNYIGSVHQPNVGEDGCTIMVKLRQMSKTVQEPEHVAWRLDPAIVRSEGEDIGRGAFELEAFRSGLERVTVLAIPPETELELPVPRHGRELLVVDGSMSSSMGEHDEGSWVRLADDFEGKFLKVRTGGSDVYLYSKQGHLRSPEVDEEEAPVPEGSPQNKARCQQQADERR